MDERTFVVDYLDHLSGVLNPGVLTDNLLSAKRILEDVQERGAKVLFAGNGASASMASHFALDFTKQGGIRSVTFNDASLITAYCNDYGYEAWVARAIEHHGDEGDAAVLISSSGRSPNILNAVEVCRDLRMKIITFTGFESTNPLMQKGDVNFWVESRAYNVVEGVHGIWLGLLCDLLIGKMEYGVKG